ncbi:hypothetical protein CCMA1212_000396 [Trichoderma ghanense]|uniref:Uncharacterized protein n=1 Tax=Trichoderma ghanense TaxID=65468 RepID=A0ABY2HHK2_9HYPO
MLSTVYAGSVSRECDEDLQVVSLPSSFHPTAARRSWPAQCRHLSPAGVYPQRDGNSRALTDHIGDITTMGARRVIRSPRSAGCLPTRAQGRCPSPTQQQAVVADRTASRGEGRHQLALDQRREARGSLVCYPVLYNPFVHANGNKSR